MQIYVRANSKKAVNDLLANGQEVIGFNYTWDFTGGYQRLDENLPIGTVIKIYSKMIDGNPYAKAYGIWDGKKVK